jgi:hypothetical protein
MSTLVTSPQRVRTNIDRFYREVEQSPALQGRLAYARAWYAYRHDDGQWRFGPSKFVGYEGMNANTYMEHEDGRDGRRTEAQLQQWFTVVDPASELHEELSAALFTLVARYGKVPSTKMRINILKTEYEQLFGGVDQADPNDTIVDLMVAVGKSLPPFHLERLRARLSG